MVSKTLKETCITIRLSDEELAVWNKAWREQGYSSRSEMIRKCVNSTIKPGAQNTGPRTMEGAVHLDRIATSLIGLETLILADDDNALRNSQLAKDLQTAILHVHSLK